MIRLFVLSFLSFVTLSVQAQMLYRIMPYSLDVHTFSMLQKRLVQERSAAVIVISPNINDAKVALTDIMSDEKILPFSLYNKVVSYSDGIGKPICDFLEWKGNETRWAFIDSRGEITVSGVNFPNREDLLKAIDNANIYSRLEILRHLTRQSPEFLEAQMELLYELRKIGDVRTFRALRLNLPAVPEFDVSLTLHGAICLNENDLFELSEDDSLLLEDSLDEDIWEEYVRIFNTLMPELLHMHSSLQYTIDTFIPFSLPFSARLKKSANSLSITVEKALQMDPSSETLWKLWIALKPDRSIADLLDSLVPGPFTNGNDWPPPAAKAAYIVYCRNNKDWGKIIDLTKPIWNKTADNMTGTVGIWMGLLEPLLESLLATNRIIEAEHILNIWSQKSAWEPALARAAKIAKRYGFDDFAITWGKRINK